MSQDEEDKKITKKVKSNLTPCADWDLIPNNKTIGIPILQNASLLKAVTINGKKIVVQETCAFDSISQVVANGISMSDTYNTESALNSCNEFIKFLTNIVTRGKIAAADYCTRASILCNISF